MMSGAATWVGYGTEMGWPFSPTQLVSLINIIRSLGKAGFFHGLRCVALARVGVPRDRCGRNVFVVADVRAEGGGSDSDSLNYGADPFGRKVDGVRGDVQGDCDANEGVELVATAVVESGAAGDDFSFREAVLH